LVNLSYALRLSGALYEAEAAVRRAVLLTREERDIFWQAVSLQWLGMTMSVRGIAGESTLALKRALRMAVKLSHIQGESYVNCYLARRALWFGEFAEARTFADRAWTLANIPNYEGDVIRATRMQGETALGEDDYAVVDERLHNALARARMVNLAEEELPALVGLAELRRRQGELGAARELLEDVWEAAGRGPYRLIHADACCVLAEVEREEGNREESVEAAGKAYRLAWCDGPPFAYHWGLERARKLLKELGAGEPGMPAFDASRFEPMPEVEIDPADEFGAGSAERSEG
jgi:tetratricopeptide (TPR) repeat protein